MKALQKDLAQTTKKSIQNLPDVYKEFYRSLFFANASGIIPILHTKTLENHYHHHMYLDSMV